MTLTEFQAQYPEFQSADDALVSVFLSAAASQLSVDRWGTYYDQAHGLLAAHLMAVAPNGQFARLHSDKGDSTYGVRFRQIRDEITFADRVF